MKTKAKEWAKLAKKTDKATTKALQNALTELRNDRAALIAAKAELEDRLKDAYLEAMAGEQVDLKGLETELFSMGNELAAMEAAQHRLEDAIKAAKVREAQARLEKVTQEIEKVKGRITAHHEKGMNLLAQALEYLGSAQGFNGGNLVEAAETLSKHAAGMARDYAQVYHLVPKPKTHLRAKLEALNKERLELEKTLKVGSYKPSEPKEVADEPPKVTFFGL